MFSAVPALRSAIAAASLPLRSAAVASRHLISSCSIAQSHSQFQYQYRLQTRSLSHLHPSEGAGQTLQAPNTSSTAADAVTAALGTSEPPVGASSESKAVGIDELRVKAKKLYKEVSWVLLRFHWY